MKADRSFIRSIQGGTAGEGRQRGRRRSEVRNNIEYAVGPLFSRATACPCNGGSEKLAFESVPIALERAREIGETPYPSRDYRERYPAA